MMHKLPEILMLLVSPPKDSLLVSPQADTLGLPSSLHARLLGVLCTHVLAFGLWPLGVGVEHLLCCNTVSKYCVPTKAKCKGDDEGEHGLII